jgi:hypothetical protein
MTFQRAAGRQGRQFADQCNEALAGLGFRLLGKRNLSRIGVELDQVGVTPTGAELWFEFKGSFRGKRPGLRRTDTTKKAIANGALVRTMTNREPFIVLTSHLPERGAALAMLDVAMAAGYVTAAISIYETGWESKLKRFF